MTTKQPVGPPVVACYDELADLLTAMRPDTSFDDWRRAMLACQTVGWTFERTLLAAALVIRDHDGPRQLRDAAGPLANRPRQDHP